MAEILPSNLHAYQYAWVRPVHGPAHGPKFEYPAQLGRPMGFLGGPWAGPFGPFGPQICTNYMQDIQYY
jgi:hypothetical protein